MSAKPIITHKKAHITDGVGSENWPGVMFGMDDSAIVSKYL